MKNRPYEELPVATTALQGQHSSFAEDYATVVRWCLENCRVGAWSARFRRELPPEPFGLAPREGIEAAGPNERLAHAMEMVEERKDEFSRVYDLMSDDESKDMLLTVLAYRGLGWRFVKLPLDTPEFHKTISDLQADAAAASDDKKLATSDGFAVLSTISLQKYGFDADVLQGGWGAFSEFLYSQYVYRSEHGILAPCDGDVAFDCGACWGAGRPCFSPTGLATRARSSRSSLFRPISKPST